MQPDLSLDKYIPFTAEYWPKEEEDTPEYGILNHLPFKSRDVIERVIADRVAFIRDSIEEIRSQIKERQGLKHDLSEGIDEDICEARSALFELDSLAEVAPGRRSSLEKQIMDLRKEKRNQELLLWQDTVMLKRDLRKAEKELRSAMLDLWMVRFLS